MNLDLISHIENSIAVLLASQKQNAADYGDWQGRFEAETGRLLTPDGKLRRNILENFRGMQLFVADRPVAKVRGRYSPTKGHYSLARLANKIIGARRGGIQEALDTFEVVEQKGYLDLLARYPSPDVGNPLNIEHKGYRFTNRYVRHIYHASMLRDNLGDRLPEAPVIMDVGCSYAIFSSLTKRLLPKSRHVLVDLPGQLILAHYYLGTLFPEARIAGFKEVAEAKVVDRAFVEQYDFVLLPTDYYDKLAGGSVDVVTNFFSLSEMSRKWFDTYIASAPFKTARFIYTVNRYDAYPTYSNDVTLLNYPLEEYEHVYFRPFPFLRVYYRGHLKFFYWPVPYPSQFFEFFGERPAVS